MRIIRILGSVALWIGALLGVAAGGVWVAGQLGYIQPMVVISGSMEPGIMTGDLLIGRFTPTADIDVGDVVSVPSELTGKLVTHRVTSIAPLDADRAEQLSVDLSGGPRWELRMKGDANADGDLEPYFPRDQVLTPLAQIPQGGKVVSKVMEPAVAMPILLALLALLGLSLLDEPQRKVARRVINRVRPSDPRVDELDESLASVGVDVEQLQEMDDLDLQLYSLGIDIAPRTVKSANGLEPDEFAFDEPDQHESNAVVTSPRSGCGVADRLWNLRLPESDGIGLVPVSSSNPPTLQTFLLDPLLPAMATSQPADADQRTPARSG
jgi:signal peptidase